MMEGRKFKELKKAIIELSAVSVYGVKGQEYSCDVELRRVLIKKLFFSAV